MPDLPPVPAIMSLEGRAMAIAEETGRIEHAGNPDKRREHVRMVALAHLRAVAARAANGEEVRW